MKETIAWAFAGTGGITNQFIRGLKSARGAKALAVASRSMDTARAFAARYGVEKAFDDYDAMVNDPAVDVVYIGTPHTTHRDLAVKALRAKKAVLCEKPVCINSGEMADIVKTARENRVFFMEAMWTRFTPPLCKVREWLSLGLIGEVKMIQANFGFRVSWNPEGRLLNPLLGGGALLDAGVYPVSFASMVFGPGMPVKIAAVLHLGETGVDEECAALLSWGGSRIASIGTAVRTAMCNDAWVYGSEGRIHIPGFVFAHRAELEIYGKYIHQHESEYYSNGYNYEAEEVMNCIREGKTESAVMPLDESVVIMKIMDEIRAQGNFTYPCEA
ncbi:MAG: Gfo/Idh/MocA family oxidoreductase [Treponema sp.]|jgi:predicted dehydrogenase|nr:Gfo/Idh/MocA family oxidoreductase [Treponema sp.]